MDVEFGNWTAFFELWDKLSPRGKPISEMNTCTKQTLLNTRKPFHVYVPPCYYYFSETF